MGTTPLSAGTNVSETIGGKEYGRSLLADTAGTDAMGVVGASPAANTLLGRLKAVVDAVLSLVGLTAPADTIFTIAPGTGVLSTIPKALFVTADGTLAVGDASNSSVSLGSVKAGQLIPIRARYVYATGTTATVIGLA